MENHNFLWVNQLYYHNDDDDNNRIVMMSWPGANRQQLQLETQDLSLSLDPTVRCW